MYEIFKFLLDNIRLILFAVSGLFSLFAIIGKTFGLRYSFLRTLMVFLGMMFFRTFGFNLFYSIYLGSIYSEEEWYGVVLFMLSVLSVLIGIVCIAILFKGNLLKLLLLESVLEILITFIISLVIMASDLLFCGQIHPDYMSRAHIYDLVIPLVGVAFYLILTRRYHWILQRYADWKIRYPAPLVVAIVLFYLFGMGSNMNYAFNQGDRGSVFMIGITIILTFTILISFLNDQRIQEVQTNADLVRQENALDIRYGQILEQSARIARYNTEIREGIQELIEKILIEGKEMDSSGEEDPGTMDNIAHYLEDLHEQYQELSVSRYCQDPLIDQTLEECVHELEERHVNTAVAFSEYRTPPGVSKSDISELIRWLMLGINGVEKLVLQGGFLEEEIVLVCNSWGKGLKNPSLGEVRKILRRLRADYRVEGDENNKKIVIAIP